MWCLDIIVYKLSFSLKTISFFIFLHDLTKFNEITLKSEIFFFLKNPIPCNGADNDRKPNGQWGESTLFFIQSSDKDSQNKD